LGDTLSWVAQAGKEFIMEKKTKVNIDECVKAYQDVLSWEYAEFLKAIRVKREALKDDKLGTMKNTDMIERVLYEIPASLFDILTRRLDVQELKELRTKQGARWFAKTYPQYRLVKQI